MAGNSEKNALGILFDVKGGGSISGESGKQILKSLNAIVDAINGSGDFHKIELDFEVSESKIAKVSKHLKEINNKAQKAADKAGSTTVDKDEIASSVENGSKAFKEAIASVTKYYNLLTQIQNAMTRTTAIIGSESEGFRINSSATPDETGRWTEMVTQLEGAKEAYDKLKVSIDNANSSQDDLNMSAEQLDIVQKKISSSRANFDLQSSKSTANAKTAWGGLTAKVHEYINSVKFSASRDLTAAQGLKELEDIANNNNYQDYDKLKQKLAEVRHYIDQNSLATETWGQKLAKTFGSRVRSALAGIFTAKIGQALNNIYKNVVNLDKAMTDLQIASGKNREEVKELTKGYSELAKQLGSTTNDVAKAADTWLRQGYAAEETNTLIRNSTMLAKLGQMESAEASTALTSAMRGYGVAVEESIGIVDKFTKVDMEAAASAGDIATAMAETAASAKIAGVSMDTLIGYIATVKEVTQDSSESVGTFFKTLLARMNNVAAGNFIDEETGEALNDVEQVLNGVGIALRDANGQFRASSEVLDEVGRNWANYDTVQKHAIATAMAGTRQQEKLFVLFENYGDAINYANTAANSSGTAMEKFGAYTDSIEGRMNSLTSSFEKFSMTILDSDLIALLISVCQTVLDVAEAVISLGDGAIPKFAIAIGATILIIPLLNKALKSVGLNANLAKTSFRELGAAIKRGTGQIGKSLLSLAKNPVVYIGLLVAAFSTFTEKVDSGVPLIIGGFMLLAAMIGLALSLINKSVRTFMSSNPLGWILLAITAVVMAAQALVKGFDAINESEEELRESAYKTAEALQEEANELKNIADSAKEASDSIESLIDDYKELDEEIDNAEWYDHIKGIGEEVAKLFPDRELSELQAINELLGTNYSYNELINLSIEERLRLLDKIEGGVSAQTQKAMSDAYNSQREASKGLAEALRYGITIESDDERWAGKEKSQIEAVVSEAARIASSIEGVTMTADGSDVDIKVDFENERDYVDKLQRTINEYRRIYQGNLGALTNNAVYQQLLTSLNKAQESINKQTSTARGVLEQAVKSAGSQLKIEVSPDMSPDDISNAYNKAIEEIRSLIDNDSVIQSAMHDGVLDTEDIKDAIEEYMVEYQTEIYNSVHGVKTNVVLKSISDMFDETDKQIDILKSAMSEMSDVGVLTADTVKTLTSEFPELIKYLKRTSKGFELSEVAMDDFLGSISQKYIKDIQNAKDNFETVYKKYLELPEDQRDYDSYLAVKDAYKQYESAIENANNYILVETTQLKDTLEDQYTEILENQKEALEEQQNAYKDLCDVRKDLLSSLQEEVQYKRELEKKTQNLTRLQTKLNIASLDKSAAGRARYAEIKMELEDAQEEFDEFTLDHAIEEVTKQIDSSMSEYESFIERQIAEIEQTIEKSARLTAEELSKKISDNGETPVYNTSGSAAEIQGAIDSAQVSIKDESDIPDFKTLNGSNGDQGGKTGNVATPPATSGTIGAGNYGVIGLNASNMYWGWDDIAIKIGNEEYEDLLVDEDYRLTDAIRESLNNIFGGESKVKTGTLAYLDNTLWVKTMSSGWARVVPKKGNTNFSELIEKFKSYGLTTYHTGGLVGDVSTLDSSEEFAKLLKGEFVSTPAQMERFMNDTLPAMMNFSGGGGVEINAPLITIDCGSVTTESMPALEKVVKEAVNEVKKQLDNGMSRAGRKISKNKLNV